MKLRLKLPLAFALAMGLLFLAGLIGILRLSGSVTVFEKDVLHSVAAHKKAAEVATDFATAVQEWKNVLLRGKDPKDRDKYWQAHLNEMKEALKDAQELAVIVGEDTEKPKVQKLIAGLNTAAAGYQQAYEAFQAADGDPQAGDKAARGKDRDAAVTLKELRDQLSKDEQSTTEQALDAAASAWHWG